jgi:SAM-dependent methyltransferase
LTMQQQERRPSGATPYDRAFYHGHQNVVYQSASIIVPLILSLFPFESVVDAGCGIGTWAGCFLESGVPDVIGIDGDYVERSMLCIPQERFFARDLRMPIHFERRFQLAVCLEVGEHLPEARSRGLVHDLVSLAPCVLFSAALPGQGGTDHINEQYLSKWASLFATHDFVALDLIRHQIWNRVEVAWWYRQNIVLFAHKTHPLVERHAPSTALDYIHPRLGEQWRRQPSFRELAHALPRALFEAVSRRLKPLNKGLVRTAFREPETITD